MSDAARTRFQRLRDLLGVWNGDDDVEDDVDDESEGNGPEDRRLRDYVDEFVRGKNNNGPSRKFHAPAIPDMEVPEPLCVYLGCQHGPPASKYISSPTEAFPPAWVEEVDAECDQCLTLLRGRDSRR